jgi:hypothetical protein
MTTKILETWRIFALIAFAMVVMGGLYVVDCNLKKKRLEVLWREGGEIKMCVLQSICGPQVAAQSSGSSNTAAIWTKTLEGDDALYLWKEFQTAVKSHMRSMRPGIRLSLVYDHKMVFKSARNKWIFHFSGSVQGEGLIDYDTGSREQVGTMYINAKGGRLIESVIARLMARGSIKLYDQADEE